MRYLGVGMLVCFIMGGASGAATPDASLVAPIQKFIDSFNKGDMAAAAATHAADAGLTIIDEVAPHLWHGPKAFQDWSAALESDAKKNGITDQVVKIDAPIRQVANGDRAYVVVPAVYTFKEKGVAMREAAQMTFALEKGSTGWLIHGWTWTGPNPKPAKP